MDATFIICVIAIWVYEGFSLKYLDQIVDEGRIVRRTFIWFVMLVAGVASAVLMAFDTFTSGSVLALILGMILSRKIDHKLWVLQIMFVLASYISCVVVLAIASPTSLPAFWDVVVIFVIVLVFSVADEIFHEFTAKRGHVMHTIGDWRVIMKVVVVVLPFFLYSYIFWYHAVAWIAFDLIYQFTAYQYEHARDHPKETQRPPKKEKVID
nr:hypothetical protein [Candidatus Sigynarchaeota archaeon]